MPGITLKIPGASFSKFIDREFPHVNLATGYWLFGGDEAASKRNLIDGTDSSIVALGGGVPVYGKGYVDLPVGATAVGFDTGIVFSGADKSAFTYIAVTDAVASSGFGHLICGTHHSNVAGNYLARSTSGVTAAWNGASAITVGTAPAGSMVFVAATNSPTGRAAYFHNGTTLNATAAGTGAVPVATQSYRIGPASHLGNQTLVGTQRHAANLLFKSQLDATQLAAVYDYLKWKLGKRGVTVT